MIKLRWEESPPGSPKNPSLNLFRPGYTRTFVIESTRRWPLARKQLHRIVRARNVPRAESLRGGGDLSKGAPTSEN